MPNTAMLGVVITTQVRGIAETEGLAIQTALQNSFVKKVQLSHAELERELAIAVKSGGFSAADQATIFTNILTAMEAVTW